MRQRGGRLEKKLSNEQNVVNRIFRYEYVATVFK